MSLPPSYFVIVVKPGPFEPEERRGSYTTRRGAMRGLRLAAREVTGWGGWAKIVDAEDRRDAL